MSFRSVFVATAHRHDVEDPIVPDFHPFRIHADRIAFAPEGDTCPKRVFVDFEVDEQTYLQTIRGRRDEEKMPVELTLSSDSSVVYEGEIHSFDNVLDVSSGTIRARGILKNKDGALIPGMFANVRLGSPSKKDVLLLDEKAIGTDQSKKYVYIVDSNNKVKYREITLGRSVGGDRIVLSGLQEGEKVMVNSLQRVRPESEVNPVDIAEKNKEEVILEDVTI